MKNFKNNRRLLLDYLKDYPEREYLIKEFSNENNILINDLYIDNQIRYIWNCSSCKRIFKETIVSRLKLTLRIKCNHKNIKNISNETIIEGLTLQDSDQTVLEHFDYIRNFPLAPKDFELNQCTKIWWRFKDCGHLKKKLIRDVNIKGQRCGDKKCRYLTIVKARSNNLKYEKSIASFPKILKSFHKDNLEDPRYISRYSNKKYYWNCVDCSIKCFRYPPTKEFNLIGTICKECSNKRKSISLIEVPRKRNGHLSKSHPEIYKEIDFSVKDIPEIHLHSTSKYKASFNCRFCSKTFKMVIYNRVRNRLCPNCHIKMIGKKAIKRSAEKNSLLKMAPKLAKELHPTLNKYKASEISWKSNQLLTWTCKKGHTWKQSPKNRIKYGNICKKCQPAHSSIGEKEVLSFLKNTYSNLKIKENFRFIGINNGSELDIYIPELKLGIEYNGNYWHSDDFMKKQGYKSSFDYHKNKVDFFSTKNIKVIFIWEEDWKFKNVKVKEKLIKLIEDHSIDPIFLKLSVS